MLNDRSAAAPVAMPPALSYLSGTSSTPLLHATIGACLTDTAGRTPDTEAVVSVYENVRWTYAELDQRATALASGLLDLGLVPGDRLGIWAQNSANWLLVQFAAAKAGLTLVSFNTAYRRTELEFVLNKVGCRALVMATGLKGVSYIDMIDAIDSPDLEWCILTHPSSDAPADFLDLDTLGARGVSVDHAALNAVQRQVQFDDIINIQFTSGTTGRPKGVALSHHSLVNNGYFVGLRAGIRQGDRICTPVPLFHCFGMVMASLAAVTHGATIVLPAAVFDAQATLAAVEKERCTHLYGVPTMFIAELSHPDFGKMDLSSLRGGIMAGSPCPVEVMRQVVDRMHMAEVTIAYGMTETSPVSLQTRIEDTLDQRVQTVGTIMPHLEVKIVDPNGLVVPRSTDGELCTRGYSVMRGYWDDPEATAAVLDPSGWMHSGDVARMDDDGFVEITGRIKDLIIRGGENISPREIEEVLYQHPGIIDVQVVGVPDPKFGEVVCACLKTESNFEFDEDGLRRFCGERLAHYKVPKFIQVMDEFPTTPSGKVQKAILRQQMSERLNNQ